MYIYIYIPAVRSLFSMSSRFEVEEICLHFLHGRVGFLLDIIDKYRETYASIDRLDLSVVTLSSAFVQLTVVES